MSTVSRPFARSGFLIAMLAGAALGTVVARGAESAVGGADPEFVGVLGAAFGGILGRSVWMRVRRAREDHRGVAPPILLLVARVVLCVVCAVALFGPAENGPFGLMAFGGRVAVAVLALIAFMALGVVEYRWLSATRRTSHVD